ncbi:MAG TPA: hypothetical protein VGS79_13240 [Puia sp.]|nr:hypothetical protein [Puia sp.]
MEANETISPSAYALLMMKSHTSIPYAREAAALAAAQQARTTPGTAPASTDANATALSALPSDRTRPSDLGASPASDVDPLDYWMRVMHFESRYWTINQLLEDLTATNILEISSGFSFRGLDLSYKKPVFYIDTDLPNIIAGKQQFIDALTSRASAATPGPAAAPNRPGHYELQPLNALDPIAFEAIVNKFPPGPLTIINEGLLVYLDPTEKAQLCANIRKALLARGGRWITADVYIKRQEDDAGLPAGPSAPLWLGRPSGFRQWSNEHGLEEKKFASFSEAGTFFHSMGFEIEKEATQDYSRLTSFAKFLNAVGPEGLSELRRRRPASAGPTSATWRLAPKGSPHLMPTAPRP